MRIAALVAVLVCAALLGAACGSHGPANRRSAASSGRPTTTTRAFGPRAVRCAPGDVQQVGSRRLAYAGFARHGAVAYRLPGRSVLARFGPTNANGYPSVFGVVGIVVRRDCTPAWYRVELPLKPNGSTGYVRAASLAVARVRTRIEVSVSGRRLTLYRRGKAVLHASVAVGAPATPTPTGSYYVDQRLLPDDPNGPFGPEAIGISAYSNVLTGWTQGGPVAIHGTNEPWSIGENVSNGCIRLPNTILRKVFPLAVAGTPVIISP
ncbi:MAG TPA: L,D-transpeptidase [Gaiellaceae bacterium]|nr:L,D-transpeptidase [Gaiellaceae bacterium]